MDRAKIDEGTQILDRAMLLRRAGPYQPQAAIAACHASGTDGGGTDWQEVAVLYAALDCHSPSPVVRANRAVAVAMAEGPAAGLAILDELRGDAGREEGISCMRAGLTCCGSWAVLPRRPTPTGPRSPSGRPSRAAVSRRAARRTDRCHREAGGRNPMTTAEDGIAAQIRNIEDRYGKPLSEWFALITASGLAKHTEIVAMLKADHGMTHGAAHRVSLLSRQAAWPAPTSTNAAVDALYTGKKAGLRPLHDQLMTAIHALGADVSTAPKKGYISIRRTKQFAMIQPSAAGRLDVGLILRGTPAAGRLEPAGGFNALFTHRVRVTSPGDIDAALTEWLQAAYMGAG